MSTDIVLRAILSYPQVFEPTQVQGQGEFKYRARLILDPQTDWGRVNGCITEAIAKKWPSGAPAGLEMPFHDATKDGFPGQYYISANSGTDYPPQVVDQNINRILDRSSVFGGCIVNASVNFYGAAVMGNQICVGLNAIQIVDNGPNVHRLDGRKDAKDLFQPIAGAPAQLSPTPYSYPQPHPTTPAPQPYPTTPAPQPYPTTPAPQPYPTTPAPHASVPPGAPFPYRQ